MPVCMVRMPIGMSSIRYSNQFLCIFQAGTSWTAKNSDFQQKLTIDLGSIRNITAIAIQGCPLNDEYVTEYTISYGSNGIDYADFLEPGGNIKVTSNFFAISQIK